MRSMLILSSAALATVLAGPVYADCAVPTANAQIPNGRAASHDEMVAAQKAVKAYDTAVKQYTDCLQQEQGEKVAAGGDKEKLTKEYAKKQNAQVDQLQQLVDKFNIELKAFKAKNTG